MDHERTSAVLTANRLLEFGRDCAGALASAAEVAESAAERRQYYHRAASWTHFCAALQAAVRRLGGVPPERIGPGGTLQHAWIKIKSRIGDVKAIAAQCLKHEADTLDQCAQALERGLPPELDYIVRARVRDGADRRVWPSVAD
jgi:uncharacterized protein (TIGR02284 family)